MNNGEKRRPFYCYNIALAQHLLECGCVPDAIGRGIEDWWLEETQTGRFGKSEREFLADILQSLNDEYEAQ